MVAVLLPKMVLGEKVAMMKAKRVGNTWYAVSVGSQVSSSVVDFLAPGKACQWVLAAKGGFWFDVQRPE